MLLLTVLLAHFAGDPHRPLSDIAHRHLVGPHGIDPKVDCAMRNVTWAYAKSILPQRLPMLEVRVRAFL